MSEIVFDKNNLKATVVNLQKDKLTPFADLTLVEAENLLVEKVIGCLVHNEKYKDFGVDGATAHSLGWGVNALFSTAGNYSGGRARSEECPEKITGDNLNIIVATLMTVLD